MRRFTAILALALVVTACGDDDGDTTTTAAATSTTTTIASGSTTAGGTVGGVSGDIQALLDLYAVTPLRTTYLFGEGDDQLTVVFSQDPTATPPVSAILLDDGGKIITTPDQTIMCDPSGEGCFVVPDVGGESLLQGILGPVLGGFFLAAGIEQVPGASVTHIPSVIAGRDGTCFEFVPPVGAGFDTTSLTQCIDSEFGFTLYVENTPVGGEPERVMELVEFGDPLPDDFTPTGPVTDPNP